MKFIALLRGINVGGNNKVEMQKLKELLEKLGYENVITYINSGNVIFQSSKPQSEITKEIPAEIEKKFGFEVPCIIKNEKQFLKIVGEVPEDWQNNKEQKSDIAFLFDEIDNKKILEILPVKKEFINLKYTKGALLLNVKRSNYNKSQLNKIIQKKIYKQMTLRNVNTTLKLAKMLKEA